MFPTSEKTAVRFEKVSKVFSGGLFGRDVRALDGVSLSIAEGEVFGLIGPNRAGKTTLVKILLSICRPTAGRFWRLGKHGKDRGTLARVGYVHESQAFPRYLTARSLLEYYGALSWQPAATVRRRAGELLDRVGLADRSREPIGRFSKGMLQRLALAQAMINDPELLVLDEPSEGMDLAARRLLQSVIRERQAQGARRSSCRICSPTCSGCATAWRSSAAASSASSAALTNCITKFPRKTVPTNRIQRPSKTPWNPITPARMPRNRRPPASGKPTIRRLTPTGSFFYC